MPEQVPIAATRPQTLPITSAPAFDADIRTSAVCQVRYLNDLEVINRPEISAVIWNRPVPEKVRKELESVAFGTFEGARYVVDPNDVVPCAAHIFGTLASFSEPLVDWLASDIDALSRALCRMFETSQLVLRTEVVRDDACRRFHVDAVRARSICTYVGPGTEYGLSNGGDCPDQIKRMPTGMPALFKGKLWPGGDLEPRFLHRSPPIKGSGLVRLVVIVEPYMPEQDMPSPYERVFSPPSAV